ncbi:hypothetical protein GCM10017559_16130 [Streptosporangium longisporum]|uniref:Tryptophan-rich sensory protein n=1 Tax=Streptosporangium longisporum TaxID=46187 RepID=A0ABN3XTW0_9ACTN
MKIVTKGEAPRTRRGATGVRTGVILAVASAVNYLAWLGWDRQRDVAPDGSVSGPYQAWQVAGLVIVLGILAVVAGRRGHPVLGTAAVAVVTWLAWSVDAALSDDSGLWVVGSLLLLPALLLGVGLVAFLASRRGGAAG